MTGEFPAQMASDAENVSIWWRHHGDVADELYQSTDAGDFHPWRKVQLLYSVCHTCWDNQQ